MSQKINSMHQQIKEYWELRAKEVQGKPSATTNDVFLRELEIRTLVTTIKQFNIPSDSSAIDIGCGDGYSTLNVAQQLEGIRFLGIDYSESMINSALQRLESMPEFCKRVSFFVGDATLIAEKFNPSSFDIAITDRCLINLESPEIQYDVIRQIYSILKPGGYYIAIENFVEGNEAMNAIRNSIGLPEIPIRWHNLYFKQSEFVEKTQQIFEDVQIIDFSSSYYFATRVIYSKMCQMRNEQPDYYHEIHQLAIHLPWIGAFSPIKMALIKKAE